MCAISFDVQCCLSTECPNVLLQCVFTDCPPGFYGQDCKENCSTNCIVPVRCDRMTGQCEGGCQAGWTQSKCDSSRNIPFFIKCKTPFLCAGILCSYILNIKLYILYVQGFNLGMMLCNNYAMFYTYFA